MADLTTIAAGAASARLTEFGGLLDRGLFLDRIELALLASDRGVAVIALDVDRLRRIGDSLGHAACGEILETVAGRLRATIGAERVLARVTDDEFAVLCESGAALALAARLLDALVPAIVLDEEELFVTASAGIAFAVPGTRTPAASLMRDATVALHRAQRRGPGCLEVFAASMRTELVDELRTELDLRRGIAAGELRIAYQPLVSLRSREVTGVESLVRWAHPTRGLIAPARFLPVAERSGLISRIGAWVLHEACRQAAVWSAGHPERLGPCVTVNISTHEITDPAFVDVVVDALQSAGLVPGRLVLDITEGAFHDGAAVLEVLHELKALGVGLYLDDFVTGNAALSWLTRFPLDGLKLESAFVGRLGADPKVRALLEAVCGMARAFDLAVVAEGVETEEQAAILEELGCDTAQGYLFSRPVPAAALEPLLARALPRRADVPASDPPAGGTAGASVTMREAAEALGVSPSTVRRRVQRGRLEAVRTKGGHRRFLVDDIRRLRSAEQAGAPRVRSIPPPERALPHTAAVLRERCATIVSAGLRATYADRSIGWFARDEGRPHVQRWLRALSGALDSADYATALDATAALSRHARLGGATTVEQVTFLDRSCAALLRLLSEIEETRDELPAARRLCAALRHRALERIDES